LSNVNGGIGASFARPARTPGAVRASRRVESPLNGPDRSVPLVSLRPQCGFKQLNRIAVWILQLDLLAARTGLHLVPEMQPSLFQRFNSSGQVFDLQNYSIPSTRLLLTTVRHGTRTRGSGTA